MIYQYTIHNNGDEEWTTIRGTECYEGVVSNVGEIVLDAGSGFDFNDWRVKTRRAWNGMLGDDVWPVLRTGGVLKPCVTVPCPSFPAPPESGGWLAPASITYHDYDNVTLVPGTAFLPDWRADNFFGKIGTDQKDDMKESTLFDKDAINEAYEFIADMKREEQVESILTLIMEWGEDEYAPKTVFRFEKAFKAPSVTGSGGHASNPREYAYAAIKAENGKWYTTGNAMVYTNWDAFVKFLVTEGEPVAKEDVEIFPPAVFPVTDSEVVNLGEMV